MRHAVKRTRATVRALGSTHAQAATPLANGATQLTSARAYWPRGFARRMNNAVEPIGARSTRAHTHAHNESARVRAT